MTNDQARKQYEAELAAEDAELEAEEAELEDARIDEELRQIEQEKADEANPEWYGDSTNEPDGEDA